MESHPIPQQISSYQFRLVGDMTLKQFFQLGGGALVGLLIYSTNLHPFIKWPLILVSVSLGAALAFLPFEERPLSRWIIAFFRSVYSPTIYIWQKSKNGYNFFQNEQTLQEQTESDLTKIQPKIETEGNVSLLKLEKNEENYLSKISDLLKMVVNINLNEKKPIAQMQEQKQTTPLIAAQTIPQQTPNVIREEFKSFRPKIVVEETETEETLQQKPVYTHQVSPIAKKYAEKKDQVKFSEEAAPPLPPTVPNTITGQVLDQDGKIIEGAILEIRDLAGRPVRAVRSNKLGHFMIVTALPNGQYDIITEKEGYEFNPVTFEAKGEIVPPILIQAKTEN